MKSERGYRVVIGYSAVDGIREGVFLHGAKSNAARCFRKLSKSSLWAKLFWNGVKVFEIRRGDSVWIGDLKEVERFLQTEPDEPDTDEPDDWEIAANLPDLVDPWGCPF